MISLHSKKGFISIFWVAVIMLVTTTIMVTATYMFSTFAATPTSLILTPFQEYYNAELGISYGNFKLIQFTDLNLMNLSGGSSYTYPAIVVNGASITVTITCLVATQREHYTITSASGSRTITADWSRGVLTSVN